MSMATLRCRSTTDWWLPTWLILAVLAVPTSPTLRSIVFGLAAFSILADPSYRQQLSLVWSQPWCKAVVAFFLMTVVACLWSPAAVSMRLQIVMKYSKFLYLPIFAVGFRNPCVREGGIYVFLGTMLFVCMISIVSHHDWVFYNHIITSYMMTFATYLAGLKLIRSQGVKRLPFLLLMLLFSYQLLFINQGRVGYLLYVALVTTLLMQHFQKKYLWAGVLCVCTLFGLLSYQSSTVAHRLHEVVENLQDYQHGKPHTSIGFRLMFHDFAKSMFLASPLIGNGTGGFAHDFQRHTTLFEWKHLQEPHSGYWLIAADFGLVGLSMLLWLVTSLWRAGSQLREMRPILQATLVAFVISNMSDSILFYSSTNSFFVVWCALCLGELVEQRAALVSRS